MKVRDQKKEIKIYVKTEELVSGKPAYKVLLDKFIERDIVGCTILKSNSGYGMDMKLKYPSDTLLGELVTKESTVILTVIESEAKVEEIVKILDEFLPQGMVTIRDVEAIRYTKRNITSEDIRLAENA
ncbi:MAG: DUF190 domain-containing protein [Leptospiraceae bacterium]|nr:DUF190 domain-containing protein [Leptospiraceae bacterium]